MSQSLYIYTNGCPENRLDTMLMGNILQASGWETTDCIEKAETIILNLCAHTDTSENGSIRAIQNVKALMQQSARLIVCGCLPKINIERLRTVYDGPTFGSDDMAALCALFDLPYEKYSIQANALLDKKSITSCKPREEENAAPLCRRTFLARLKLTAKSFMERMGAANVIRYLALVSIRQKKDRIAFLVNAIWNCTFFSAKWLDKKCFYIKVCSGCFGKCSFCAIRFSRGNLVSKPVDEIIKEFNTGLREGYQLFGLLGTEVGWYGLDQGRNIIDLLENLTKIEGDYSIILRNFHPAALINNLPGMHEILSRGKIAAIHSAFESGSNRVLKAMNRGYTIDTYLKAIAFLNHAYPDISITTQVLVGFPTETDEDFAETLKVLDACTFKFVEPFPFQSRPRTSAATMPGHLSKDIIERRYMKLLTKIYFKYT